MKTEQKLENEMRRAIELFKEYQQQIQKRIDALQKKSKVQPQYPDEIQYLNDVLTKLDTFIEQFDVEALPTMTIQQVCNELKSVEDAIMDGRAWIAQAKEEGRNAKGDDATHQSNSQVLTSLFRRAVKTVSVDRNPTEGTSGRLLRELLDKTREINDYCNAMEVRKSARLK